MNKKSKVIDCFEKEYAFLSNFYESPITIEGLTYLSSEGAYQAMKTNNEEDRIEISKSLPSRAKRLGQKVELRANWDTIKVGVMFSIVYDKFVNNPVLAKKLTDTGDAILIEGNYWGDTFWGVCKGAGKNNLGEVLMGVRDICNHSKK